MTEIVEVNRMPGATIARTLSLLLIFVLFHRLKAESSSEPSHPAKRKGSTQHKAARIAEKRSVWPLRLSAFSRLRHSANRRHTASHKNRLLTRRSHRRNRELRTGQLGNRLQVGARL